MCGGGGSQGGAAHEHDASGGATVERRRWAGATAAVGAGSVPIRRGSRVRRGECGRLANNNRPAAGYRAPATFAPGVSSPRIALYACEHEALRVHLTSLALGGQGDCKATWVRDAEQFRTVYPRLAEYSRAFGDCKVPRTYRYDFELGDFVHAKRSLCKLDRLPAYQKTALVRSHPPLLIPHASQHAIFLISYGCWCAHPS